MLRPRPRPLSASHPSIPIAPSPLQAYHALLPAGELRRSQLACCVHWLGRLRLASLRLSNAASPAVSDAALHELAASFEAAGAAPGLYAMLHEAVVVPQLPLLNLFDEADAAALAPFTRLERLTLQHFQAVALPSLPPSVRELTLALPDPSHAPLAQLLGLEAGVTGLLHLPVSLRTGGVSSVAHPAPHGSGMACQATWPALGWQARRLCSGDTLSVG